MLPVDVFHISEWLAELGKQHATSSFCWQNSGCYFLPIVIKHIVNGLH